MEQSSRDRTAADWTCSVCGRTRQCPFTAPAIGQARAESCRNCGETLVGQTQPSSGALRDVIGLHLI